MLRLKISFALLFCTLAIVARPTVPDLQSTSSIRRLTNTAETSLNLNPMLSDNGQIVAFESTEDVAGTGGGPSFRALRTRTTTDVPEFVEVARTRTVSPALSSDGQRMAFASNEDLLGENSDRNSEIFIYDDSSLRQITHTTPVDEFTRLDDGNFQPAISGDGRWIVYSSNRVVDGFDSAVTQQIHLFDTSAADVTLLSSPGEIHQDTEAKVSADGSRVFFIRSTIQDGTKGDLMFHDRTSGETRPLVTGVSALTLAEGRVISNDGLRIVYSSQIAENDTELFVYDLRSNQSRQLTKLGPRVSDVRLAATISGDGKRVAFATRRRVFPGSDGSVELYLLDIPTNEIKQITNAPSAATAEVVSSLNFDGSLLAFNFPRVWSGPVSAGELANNSEIYLAPLAPRPASGNAFVLNGASKGNEPNGALPQLAPESIVSVSGAALSFATAQAKISNGHAPLSLEGTTATIQGQSAQILYVSSAEVILVLPANLTTGPTELVITNSEGFSSIAHASISPVAPGIFTAGGTGTGEAIALNADTFTRSPFDPSDGRLRVAVFATGCRAGRKVTASLDGQLLAVESVAKSETLPGLDEVRLMIPSELRGLGVATLLIEVDGAQSNPTTLMLSGSSLRDVVINEILADPPDGLSGDANNDGRRDASADEFIELINSTTRQLDLSGYRLETRAADNMNILRHRFAAGTVLPAGTALVVFGGGNPLLDDPMFGGSQVVRSSTGSLSLNNNGGTISLRTPSSELVTLVTYGNAVGLPANLNQSLTRDPDINGAFALHTEVAERSFSPGTRSNGVAFSPVPTVPTPSPSPSATPTPTPTPTATPTPLPSPFPSPSPVSSPRVVISQIFGGGGNSGAPFRNDFIEIFNNGPTSVNLDGWSVQYVSATGSTWSVTNLDSVTLSPGQYYLIQEGPTGANGSPLPTPDTVGSITMAATAGKVALVNSRTPLSGSCPNDQTIVDLVGYGSTANCFRGSGPTVAPSNTTAVLRGGNGCVDSKNNVADFIASAPNPRNRSSTLNLCSISFSLSLSADSRDWFSLLDKLKLIEHKVANLERNCFLSDRKMQRRSGLIGAEEKM